MGNLFSRVLLVFLLASPRPAEACDLTFWSWLNPFPSLARRAAKVLPLPTVESVRALREVLGTAWFTDYVVTAEALRNGLGKTLSEKARHGPLSLAEAREVIETALQGHEGLSDFHADILLDAVLAASRGNGNVKEAFDWVVTSHRPNQSVADRPLEGKLYRVRWDKRRGDVQRKLEGVALNKKGEFESYEVRADRRALIPKSFPLVDGKYVFAIDRTGEIFFATENSEWPHPTLIGGRDPTTYGSGEFLIVDGKLAWVNDGSGHFVPKDSLKNLETFFGKLPKDAFHPRFRGYLDQLQTVRLTAAKI